MSEPLSTVADTAGVEIEEGPAAPDVTNSDLVERLVAQARAGGVQLAGEGGLLQQLTKRVLESDLEGEVTDHLGYDRTDAAGRDGGNSRNGSRAKTVLTDVGPVQIAVPRDRDGAGRDQRLALPARVGRRDRNHGARARSAAVGPARATAAHRGRAARRSSTRQLDDARRGLGLFLREDDHDAGARPGNVLDVCRDRSDRDRHRRRWGACGGCRQRLPHWSRGRRGLRRVRSARLGVQCTRLPQPRRVREQPRSTDLDQVA